MRVPNRRLVEVGETFALRSSPSWSITFFLVLLIVVSRGALEVALGKQIAYGLQFGAVSAFLLLILLVGTQARQGLTGRLIAAYVFVLAALMSMAASAATHNIDFAWPYVVVMLFYTLVITAFGGFRFDVVRRIAIGPAVAVVTLALVGVALAQQFLGWHGLPGNDSGTFGSTLRPASLTGSFLHYPIALAILAYVLLGIFMQTRQRGYLWIGLIGVAGVVLSLSRSGLVLCLSAALVGALMLRTLSSKLKVVAALGTGFLVIALVFPSGQFIDRALSTFQADGAGNATRIGQWNRIIGEWLASPLIVGNQTGVYTNVTANFAGTANSVAESSVLQQLINFGLVGLISSYFVLWGSVRAAPTDVPWFRAALIGALAQSFFYQSIEVFPFMLIYAMVPFMASRYTTVEEQSPSMGGVSRRDHGLQRP